MQYARVDVRSSALWARSIKIIGSHQLNKEVRNIRKNSSNVSRAEQDKIRSAGLLIDINSQFSSSWTANSGIELYSDKVNSIASDRNHTTDSITHKRGLYPDASIYKNYSVYSMHHFRLKNWIIDAGLRMNAFSIKFEDTSIGKVSIAPTAIVYTAGVGYRMDSRHFLYGSYSSGYRAPNIDDMGTLGIVDFRYEVPATNLEPEKSLNVELGYKFKSPRWKANVAVYYMELSNIITRVKDGTRIMDGYPVYIKENTESAYINGIESELAWHATKNWLLSGNLTYNYGQNKTRSEPMRRIPPTHGGVSAMYTYKRAYFTTQWHFAYRQSRLAKGDTEDNRIPKGGTPGWNVLNFYAGIAFKNISISAGLQNLTNIDYRMHGSGINGVGRSAWVSFALEM